MQSKRHHQDEGDHAGQDEEIHRREAESGQCVDLLVHLHRAELRGEGRAGPAGHDDGGHQGAHLAGHGDADQIGDIDLGAELVSWTAPTKARISPTRNEIRVMIGKAAAPHS